jgi:hypothetical protein
MNVHPWDKILWFGKEQSEHMIELLRLSMVLFRDCDESVKSTKTRKLEATLAKFTMLFADSGYQFEKLIEGITGKKPGKTASSKKAATGTTEAVVPPGNTTKKKKP